MRALTKEEKAVVGGAIVGGLALLGYLAWRARAKPEVPECVEGEEQYIVCEDPTSPDYGQRALVKVCEAGKWKDVPVSPDFCLPSGAECIPSDIKCEPPYGDVYHCDATGKWQLVCVSGETKYEDGKLWICDCRERGWKEIPCIEGHAWYIKGRNYICQNGVWVDRTECTARETKSATCCDGKVIPDFYECDQGMFRPRWGVRCPDGTCPPPYIWDEVRGACSTLCLREFAGTEACSCYDLYSCSKEIGSEPFLAWELVEKDSARCGYSKPGVIAIDEYTGTDEYGNTVEIDYSFDLVVSDDFIKPTFYVCRMRASKPNIPYSVGIAYSNTPEISLDDLLICYGCTLTPWSPNKWYEYAYKGCLELGQKFKPLPKYAWIGIYSEDKKIWYLARYTLG